MFFMATIHKQKVTLLIVSSKHYNFGLHRDSSFNRVMAIMDEVNSSFNFDEFVKSRGATHVKSYQSRYDVGKNITIGLVRTHVNVCHCGLLYETKLSYLVGRDVSLNLNNCCAGRSSCVKDVSRRARRRCKSCI